VATFVDFNAVHAVLLRFPICLEDLSVERVDLLLKVIDHLVRLIQTFEDRNLEKFVKT